MDAFLPTNPSIKIHAECLTKKKNIHPCKPNGIRIKIVLFFINPTVVRTSESWNLCYLELDFFLTLNESLSVSFRCLNVSKLEMTEMVAGKDAELALVLVVVAALLITLLIVSSFDILFPHFGQKRYDFKSIQPHFPRNEGSHYQTRSKGHKEVWVISLDPGPGIYFCTGTYISVLELILSYSNIYICTGIHIFLY